VSNAATTSPYSFTDSAKSSKAEQAVSSGRISFMDFVERVAVLGLYAFFLKRMLVNFMESGNIGNLLMLVTESILVVFILCRKRANNISLHWFDWFLAFGATSLPLLVIPYSTGAHIWDAFAVSLTFLGLFIQVVSKMTLGRRFGVVAANRGLCMSGPYRIVRHPIYMGYVFSHFGFLLLNPTLWNAAIYLAVYSLKIPRILAEERVLGEDAEYKKYKGIVRFRLLPGIF
jgi:protein-S-isoprenylcysteine O-methyltransferase Ste14